MFKEITSSLKMSAAIFLALLFWCVPFALIGLLAACADNVGTPKATATVRCYSAAEPIVTSRAIQPYAYGDNFVWTDSASGMQMRASGDCLLTYDRRP